MEISSSWVEGALNPMRASFKRQKEHTDSEQTDLGECCHHRSHRELEAAAGTSLGL